jgi:hypothetical protein
MGVFVPFFNVEIESKLEKERRKRNLNKIGMIRSKTKESAFYL